MSRRLDLDGLAHLAKLVEDRAQAELKPLAEARAALKAKRRVLANAISRPQAERIASSHDITVAAVTAQWQQAVSAQIAALDAELARDGERFETVRRAAALATGRREVIAALSKQAAMDSRERKYQRFGRDARGQTS